MPRDIPITKLRNIGIMAHVDAGKTTVTERILYFTGLVHRVGEVHHGNATTDFLPEEVQHGITISAATITTSWAGHTLRIIDTPGHVDFGIEVERSLRVLDSAIFVLDAASGVECQSETVWRQADRYGVPRLSFVNKMDKVGADFARCVRELRERLGARPAVVQLPIGVGADHRGVVDLVSMRACVFDEACRIESIPDSMIEEAQRARVRLIEACAEVDERALDAFVHGRDLDADALERALRKGTIEGRLHPVLCGSAFKNKGIQPLLDAVVAYLPSPVERPSAIGTNPDTREDVQCAPREDEPFAALAFKSQGDARGTLTFLRVYSGRLQRGDTALVPSRSSRGERERIGRLYVVFANDREEVSEACAGDIVAALGLRHVRTGDTLCAPERPVVLESIEVPEPVLEVVLEPRTSEDRERLGRGLARLLADDPSLRVRVDDDSGETILRAMGELHVEVATSRLAREHHVEVRTGRPSVAYFDTVRGVAEVDRKLQKQSGGPGQFARVKLVLEPTARGSGIDFVDETVGGSVPIAFVPAVEKGVRAAAARGVRNGHPLVDFRVRLVDGEFHPKDSSAMAFEIVAASALVDAAQAAGLVLLEPIMSVEVTVPDSSVGDVLGDLASRRGVIAKMIPRMGASTIVASVPLASMFGWVSVLRDISHGRGAFSSKPSGYEPVPERIAAKVIVA